MGIRVNKALLIPQALQPLQAFRVSKDLVVLPDLPDPTERTVKTDLRVIPASRESSASPERKERMLKMVPSADLVLKADKEIKAQLVILVFRARQARMAILVIKVLNQPMASLARTASPALMERAAQAERTDSSTPLRLVQPTLELRTLESRLQVGLLLVDNRFYSERILTRFS